MAEYEKEVSAQGEYKVERKEEVHHGGILHHHGAECKEEVKIQQHHGEEYKDEAHKHGAGILGVFKKHEEEGYSGDEVKVEHKEEVKHHDGLFHHGVEYKEEVKVDHKHGDDYEQEKKHGGIFGVFKKHEHGGEVEQHDTSAYEHKHSEKEHHGRHGESKYEVDEVKYKVNDEDEVNAY